MSTDHATLLFGGTSDATAPAPTQPSATSDAPATSPADSLYAPPVPYAGDDGAPQAVKDLRAADKGRSMYSPQETHRHSLPDDAFGHDVDVRPLREVMADLAVDPNQANAWRAVHGQIEHGLADPEAWRDEALHVIKTEGYSDADLQAARALVARDQRVYRYLHESGLGNHPDVVRHFVRLARQAR